MGHLHKRQIRKHAGRGPIAKAHRLTEEKKAKEKICAEKYKRNSALRKKALIFTKEGILLSPDFEFHQRLKALRLHQSDRVKDVAKATDLTVSLIEKLECGARRPGHETAKQLAKYFKVTLVRLTRGLDRFLGEEAIHGTHE